MVGSGADRRQPVSASREAISDIRSELAVGSSIVETLEESKDTWVCGLRRVEGWDRFNDNVVMSNNLPGVVQLLRCSVVGVGSVGESTSLHSSRIHGDSELGVGLNITTIGRELELDGRHVVDTRNITHWCRVARATLNLLAVCDGLADAKADKVVGADKRVCFTGCLTLAINGLNDGGVQSKGGLRVAISTVVVVTPVVVSTVVVTAAVTAVGTVVITAVVATVAVTAEPVVLTGYETVRLWDEESGGEVGSDKGNERELEALHDSLYRRKIGVGEK